MYPLNSASASPAGIPVRASSMKNACSETPAHDFRKGVSFNTIGLTAILGSLRSYILKLLEVQAAFLRPTMVSRACDSGAPLADPRSSIYQDWNIAETRMLTIGALARKTGSKVQTIRYYEQIGLMPEPGRTEGGQRRYGEAELEDQVGAEFARLYDAAERANGYVIDTAPLHPPGKLKETVDPTPFEDRLVSPKGLINQLRVAGVLSDAVADEAMASVIGSGEEWPSEPKVVVNRPLYLTMIASHYLSDAGLIPKLKSVFGELVVLSDVEELAKREIEQSSMASAVRAQLKDLVQSLATALEAGSVTVGRIAADQLTDTEDDIGQRDIGPLLNALNDVSDAQIFVCDDRALNKNGTFNDRRGASINTALSFDILRHLTDSGAITSSECEVALEKLYEGGYVLIPVEPERVMDAAVASNWEVGPNAALRLIRNSIHLPLIRGLLKLPEERHWLRAAVVSIAIAIRHAWSEIPKVEHAVRAANYLYEMIPDVRSWTENDNSTDRDIWVQEVTRSSVTLIGSAFALPKTHAEAYRDWFDNYVGPKEEKRDKGVMDAAARTLFESLSKPIDLSEIPTDG